MTENEFYDSMMDNKSATTAQLFQDFYEKVVATNKMIGLCDDLDNNREKLIDTYTKLLQDEIDEVKEAVAAQDKDNFVKELLDVCVVGGFLDWLEGGEIICGDYVFFGELKCYLYDLYMKDDLVEVNLYITETILHNLNINLSQAMKLVLEENLSKFPLVSECDIESEIARFESEGRYSGVYAEKVVDFDQNERIVFWCKEEYGVPKKKYLKGSSYKKCNLSEIWK